jgi:hypothetical protein
VMPLLAGGSEEAFEPTEADWAEFRAWSDELAAERHWARQRNASLDFYDMRGDDPDRPMGRGYITD